MANCYNIYDYCSDPYWKDTTNYSGCIQSKFANNNPCRPVKFNGGYSGSNPLFESSNWSHVNYHPFQYWENVNGKNFACWKATNSAPGRWAEGDAIRWRNSPYGPTNWGNGLNELVKCAPKKVTCPNNGGCATNAFDPNTTGSIQSKFPGHHECKCVRFNGAGDLFESTAGNELLDKNSWSLTGDTPFQYWEYKYDNNGNRIRQFGCWRAEYPGGPGKDGKHWNRGDAIRWAEDPNGPTDWNGDVQQLNKCILKDDDPLGEDCGFSAEGKRCYRARRDQDTNGFRVYNAGDCIRKNDGNPDLPYVKCCDKTISQCRNINGCSAGTLARYNDKNLKFKACDCVVTSPWADKYYSDTRHEWSKFQKCFGWTCPEYDENTGQKCYINVNDGSCITQTSRDKWQLCRNMCKYTASSCDQNTGKITETGTRKTDSELMREGFTTEFYSNPEDDDNYNCIDPKIIILFLFLMFTILGIVIYLKRKK